MVPSKPQRMDPYYLHDDEDDGDGSSVASEVTIRQAQHDQRDDAASLLDDIAYSTLTGPANSQLGAGLFDIHGHDAEFDNLFKDAEEDMDDNDGDVLTPNGFMSPWLERSGPVYDYLTSKQFSTCVDDEETTVQKNLIVLLQAHVLFEDCLTKKDETTRHDHNKNTDRVRGALQKALGLPQKTETACRIVVTLLKA